MALAALSQDQSPASAVPGVLFHITTTCMQLLKRLSYAIISYERSGFQAVDYLHSLWLFTKLC